MTIEARVVCDSIGQPSPRLTTFWTRYPKFVHAEHMRHRTGSYCVSSSRAIPVSKNLEEVRSDELRAAPVWWGREQKGMASGEELDDVDRTIFWHHLTGSDFDEMTPRQAAQRRWRNAALYAVNTAERMVELGVHKSIVNRLLEPFLHVNVLVTSCEPGLLNFFGLRLDKAAQPEIRALAEAMWKAWCESTPKKLEPGQWHLPFVDDETRQECEFEWKANGDYVDYKGSSPINNRIRVSTARCARLSYQSFETGKRSTVEEDLALYERLVGSHPIHASPAEHPCTPDRCISTEEAIESYGGDGPTLLIGWQHPELHGNLPGWIQFRKTLPGEAVAPLPEQYR